MLTRCKRTCRDLSVSVHICGERPVTHSLQGRFVSIFSRFPTHSVRSLRDINQNVISVRRECRIQGWVGNLKPTVHLERERLNTCFSEPRTKHRDGQGVSSQQNPTGDLHTLHLILSGRREKSLNCTNSKICDHYKASFREISVWRLTDKHLYVFFPHKKAISCP